MKIVFHRNFEKKFVKLDEKLKAKFKERKNLFLGNPLHPILNNHPLSGDRAGQWSINVTGDLRALYIFQDTITIIFIDIDTHSNLYK